MLKKFWPILFPARTQRKKERDLAVYIEHAKNLASGQPDRIDDPSREISQATKALDAFGWACIIAAAFESRLTLSSAARVELNARCKDKQFFREFKHELNELGYLNKLRQAYLDSVFRS